MEAAGVKHCGPHTCDIGGRRFSYIGHAKLAPQLAIHFYTEAVKIGLENDESGYPKFYKVFNALDTHYAIVIDQSERWIVDDALIHVMRYVRN